MDFLTDGQGDAQLILAHGAGAAMDTPFMNEIAKLLGAKSIEVVRFEFPYMNARRRGERRPPDREATLRASWMKAIETRRDQRPLFIGGKSMGGRFATMIADAAEINGVICLGYPFHPPGKPESLRVTHLENLKTATLIVQGTRDALGTREEVTSYQLSPTIEIFWSEDGDHSLKPRKSSGKSQQEVFESAVERITTFVRRNS